MMMIDKKNNNEYKFNSVNEYYYHYIKKIYIKMFTLFSYFYHPRVNTFRQLFSSFLLIIMSLFIISSFPLRLLKKENVG